MNTSSRLNVASGVGSGSRERQDGRCSCMSCPGVDRFIPHFDRFLDAEAQPDFPVVGRPHQLECVFDLADGSLER